MIKLVAGRLVRVSTNREKMAEIRINREKIDTIRWVRIAENLVVVNQKRVIKKSGCQKKK